MLLMRILKWVAGIAIALLLLLAAALVLLHLPPIERLLARQVESALSGPDQAAEIENLDLVWPFDLRLERLELASEGEAWLRAEAVALDWSPLALLGGRFEAQSLTADRIALLQTPPAAGEADQAAAEDGAPSLPQLPDLPLAVVIDRIEADILVAKAYAGEEMRLVLQGSLAAADDSLRTDLTLERQDGRAGRAALDIAYVPAEDRLDLSLQSDHDIGAMLTRLAGMPELPALALDLQGQGPLSDWRGELTARAPDALCARAELIVQGRGDVAVAADGFLRSQCFGQISALAQEQLDFAGRLVFDERGWLIRDAEIQGDFLTVTGAGRIAENRLGLDAQISAPELSRLEPLLGLEMQGAAQVQLNATGDLAEPVLTFTLTSQGGSVAGSSWQDLQAEGTAIFAETLDIVLNARAEGAALPIGIDLTGPQIAAQAAASIDFAEQRITLGRASIQSAETDLSGWGVLDQWGQDSSLSVEGNLPAGPVTGGLLGGMLAAKAQLTGNLGGNFDIALDATGRDLTATQQILADLLGDSARLQAQGEVQGNLIRIDSAVLDGQRAEILAEGSIGEEYALDLRGKIDELAAILPGFEGEGAVQLRLTGALDAPQIAGSASLETAYQGHELLAQGRYALRDLVGTPQGPVALRVDWGGIETQAETALVIGSDEIAFNDLTFSGNGIEARGGAALGLAEFTPRADLQGRIADLAAWSDLAGVALAGQGQFALELAGMQLEAQASLNDAAIAGVAAQSLTIQAEGNIGQTIEFRIEAEDQALALSAAGRADLGQAEIRIARLNLSYQDESATLAQPTTISFADGIRVDSAVFNLDPGRLSLSGRLDGQQLAAQIDAEQVPLDLAGLALPDTRLEGRVSGQAQLGGTLAAPSGSADLQLAQLGLPDMGVTGLDGRLRADIGDQRIALDADLTGDQGLSVSLSGSLPTDFAGSLDLALNITGDLQQLTAPVLPIGNRLSGDATANLAIGGSFAAPDISGRAQISNGSYRNLDLGTEIQNLTATANFSGQQFQLSGQGTDGTNGEVSLTGSGSFGAAGLSYQAQVNLRQFRAVDMDLIVARLGGTAQIRGDGSKGMLTGDLRIEEAEIDLGAAGGAGVATIDVTEVNRPGQTEQQREAEAEAAAETGYTLNLDLALAGQQISARGPGLESQWRGEIRVRGTASDPRLVGQMRIVRGNYQALGQTFDLTRGIVTFDGGEQINPALDVTAQTSAADLLASINITGRATSPQISFESTPSYPEDEILARLLFGRGAGELGAGQQLQIARALANLAAGDEGFDPVGSLRQALGLDVLDVGIEDGGAALRAGTYVGEDVYLGIEQGAEGPEAQVEIDLGRGLSLETEVGEQGQSGAGGGAKLKWRFDY